MEINEWRTAVIVVVCAFVVVALILIGDKNQSNAETNKRVLPFIMVIMAMLCGIGVIGVMEMLGYDAIGTIRELLWGQS